MDQETSGALVPGALLLVQSAQAKFEVISTADQYDDQIVSRWGGKRSTDRT